MSEKRKAFDDMLIKMSEENYDTVVDKAIDYIEEIEIKNKRYRELLLYSLEKVKQLDCECDDYNGFTCGKHNWKAKLEAELENEKPKE